MGISSMKTCTGIISRGIGGSLITIECHTSNNLPTIVIVGSASRTVTEAKHRLRGAFMNSTIRLPKKRITLNLAPADTPKSESSLDLAMATSILLHSEQNTNYNSGIAIIGELGLDGSVKPVRGIIGKLIAAKDAGITTFVIPTSNLKQARLVPDITLLPVKNLAELAQHLNNHAVIKPIHTSTKYYANQFIRKARDELDEIIGQDEAKRVLAIAAAGSHHVLLTGPPGSGKSILAKGLTSLLPPLDHNAALEATQLHSLASRSFGRLVTRPPMRTPHHSTSTGSLIGSSVSLRPGDISLSHHGVLVLDELPEFSRQSLESLRQPIEDRSITISHSRDSYTFPAQFTLIATANPCPCGYRGHQTIVCTCSSAQLQRYKTKLSGPLIDRIDLCYEVTAVDHNSLFARTHAGTSSKVLRDAVDIARRRQSLRYKSETQLNGNLRGMHALEAFNLETTSKKILETAADKLSLSTRAVLRTLSVAQTIADMEDSPAISEIHIAEALRYRPQMTKV